MEEEGIEIVMTPVQLAAVLEGETISQESSMSNRLWGGVTLVAGGLELVGSAVLFLVPEPTTVTKIAGGALAIHGADTASTGLMQVVSGQSRTTLTSQAVAAAAELAGADEETAGNIGFAVDIAVPLAAGFVGALRVAAIRGGAISLAADEAIGGHTIARHVGRTEAQLRARLASQTRIPAASTFQTLAQAEKVVGQAIRANAQQIRTWSSTANAGARLPLTWNAGRVIGQGVVRSTGQLQNMSKVRVVLQKVQANNRIYFVLTSFPVP